MGLSQPRTRVDEQGVVYGAGRLGHRLSRGERQPVGGTHHESVKAVEWIQGRRHATWLPAASFFNTSSETPFRVSKTPAPCNASAEKLWTERKLSASSISSCVSIRSRGRSCLLYWN